MKSRVQGKNSRMGEFYEFCQGCYDYASGSMSFALSQLRAGVGTLRGALNIHLKTKSIYDIDSRAFEMNFDLQALNTKIKNFFGFLGENALDMVGREAISELHSSGKQLLNGVKKSISSFNKFVEKCSNITKDKLSTAKRTTLQKEGNKILDELNNSIKKFNSFVSSSYSYLKDVVNRQVYEFRAKYGNALKDASKVVSKQLQDNFEALNSEMEKISKKIKESKLSQDVSSSFDQVNSDIFRASKLAKQDIEQLKKKINDFAKSLTKKIHDANYAEFFHKNLERLEKLKENVADSLANISSYVKDLSGKLKGFLEDNSISVVALQGMLDAIVNKVHEMQDKVQQNLSNFASNFAWICKELSETFKGITQAASKEFTELESTIRSTMQELSRSMQHQMKGMKNAISSLQLYPVKGQKNDVTIKTGVTQDIKMQTLSTSTMRERN